MKRIAVLGVSCSGKTTLGKDLSEKLGHKFVDLDDLYWLPGWKTREVSAFQESVSELIHQESWVIVGNYQVVLENVLRPADTIIWLDYSAPVVWRRSLGRTLRRILFKEAVCNGNFETLSFAYSRHSIQLWVYKDLPRIRKKYDEMFSSGAYADKDLIRVTRPREINSIFT
jgi:adenylate kinase family enzyme